MSEAERAVEAAKQLVAWANGEHYCKRCNGSGLIGNGFHELDEFGNTYAECPECDGEGEVSA